MKPLYLLLIIIPGMIAVILIFVFTANHNSSTTNISQNIIENPYKGSFLARAATEIDGDIQTLSSAYSIASEDESVIIVKNKGNLTLTNATVTKTHGDSTDTELSNNAGLNSGILIDTNSTATIDRSTIITNAIGSNGIFSTGSDSNTFVSNSTIVTGGEQFSAGINATYGGNINVNNTTIVTQGDKSPTLSTYLSGSNLSISNLKLATSGKISPIAYSLGNISIVNSTGTAINSSMAVIDGNSSLSVDNTALYSSAENGIDEKLNSGILIYNQQGNEMGKEESIFSAKNSLLNISHSSPYYGSAPMFLVKNSNAKISLSNNDFYYGSNIILKTENAENKIVSFLLTNQKITGNIETDSYSALSINLTDSSFTGSINSDNESNKVKLTLGKSSMVILTGETYVSELIDEDTNYNNIDLNGYSLFVNGVSIKK